MRELPIAVGDENIARGIPRHVGRLVEQIAGRARAGRPPPPRRSATAATSDRAAAPPRPPRPRRRTAPRAAARAHSNRFRLAAHHHRDAALLIELDHQARPAIDHPDVVLRIDLHRLRHQKSIQPLADLANDTCRSDRTQTAARRRA